MTRRVLIFIVLLVMCIGLVVLIARSSLPSRASSFISKHVKPSADKDAQAEWDETKRRAEWDETKRRAEQALKRD